MNLDIIGHSSKWRARQTLSTGTAQKLPAFLTCPLMFDNYLERDTNLVVDLRADLFFLRRILFCLCMSCTLVCKYVCAEAHRYQKGRISSPGVELLAFMRGWMWYCYLNFHFLMEQGVLLTPEPDWSTRELLYSVCPELLFSVVSLHQFKQEEMTSEMVRECD